MPPPPPPHVARAVFDFEVGARARLDAASDLRSAGRM